MKASNNAVMVANLRPTVKYPMIMVFGLTFLLTYIVRIKSKKKAVMLIKQDRVMREIEKSVMDIAKNMGLDHEYVLGKLKLLADNSEDDNIVLQSAKEIGKIIGTTGNTVKQKELGMIGMFQGFSPQQLEEAKRPLLEAREEE